MSDLKMRIGHGFDVHGFEKGDAIILGGVSVPYSKKFKAHSDGDVLIHAVCDALLGAAALGDIGRHFPDTDERFKNVDSRELLREVNALLNGKAYKIENIDITVIAQKPRLANYVKSMEVNLTNDLKLSDDQLNIKATTTEGLGFVGREEGVAVHALALLVSNSAN